jgi:hypothetical protein
MGRTPSPQLPHSHSPPPPLRMSAVPPADGDSLGRRTHKHKTLWPVGLLPEGSNGLKPLMLKASQADNVKDNLDVWAYHAGLLAKLGRLLGMARHTLSLIQSFEKHYKEEPTILSRPNSPQS